MTPGRLILAFGAIAMLVVLAATYVFVPPISQRQLRMLPTGCSTNQVLAILGRPTLVFERSDVQVWEYASWRSFQILELAVSEDGRCSSFHFEP